MSVLPASMLAFGMLTACAGGARAGDSPAPANDPPAADGVGGEAPAAGMDPAEAARREAIYRTRVDSARMRFTEADVRFMRDMIGHHAQALVMAGLAPERSASASIRTLAARIINAQRDEIAIMQRWLRDRNQPVPEVHVVDGTLVMHGAEGTHEVHGAEHAMDMPGMATRGELAELEQARGIDFDRRFLELMIRHHRGAVTMVHELFGTDGAGQDNAVFRFASDVQVDQATEVARMERMLLELSARSRIVEPARPIGVFNRAAPSAPYVPVSTGTHIQRGIPQ